MYRVCCIELWPLPLRFRLWRISHHCQIIFITETVCRIIVYTVQLTVYVILERLCNCIIVWLYIVWSLTTAQCTLHTSVITASQSF